ncbi:ATP-binding cassette domain-containing protein [Paenibacillus sp. MCAF20]
MRESAILQCDDVTVEFDGFKAIQGMDLKLEKGELRFLIGPNGAGKTTMFATMFAKMGDDERSRIEHQLEMIGLQSKASWRAGGLSHGEKQWLEIGMMLLQEPEILLLDEPVAGMTDKETDKTGELLHEIARMRSIVVVEHDMEFVRNFASKVTVMHEGRLLKEGSMDEVQRDDRVAEVYLGKRRDADVSRSTA